MIAEGSTQSGAGGLSESAVGTGAPLARPPLRADPPTPASGSDRRPASRALAGAAVAVGGVLLGIGSLLWVTGEPSTPQQVAAAVPPSAAPAPTGPLAPPALTMPMAQTGLPAPATSTAPATATAPAGPTGTGTAALDSLQASPPAPASAPATGDPASADDVASPVVPVTVLNNSRRDGLAERAALRFERAGWPVQSVGNFRGRIPVTTVYYDPGLETSARALAEAFPGVARVRPRFAQLPARGVVVVLTREYSS